MNLYTMKYQEYLSSEWRYEKLKSIHQKTRGQFSLNPSTNKNTVVIPQLDQKNISLHKSFSLLGINCSHHKYFKAHKKCWEQCGAVYKDQS